MARVRLRISFNGTGPDPVLGVAIRGNCRRVPLSRLGRGGGGGLLESVRHCVRQASHGACINVNAHVANNLQNII